MNDKQDASVKAEVYKPPFRLWFTMAIGLGFATTSITWTHYNGNMIGYLQNNFANRYTWMNDTFLSFIMTWDNILAIFIQPWIGAKSDNTWHKRFGKRTPYMLVGLPLAAIFFALIPQMKAQSFIVLILVILAFNMSMAIYRSPVVALMADLTPAVNRSLGNAVINLMGGVFAGIALFGGGYLVKNGQFENSFIMVSLVMIVAFLAFLLLVREPKEHAKLGLMEEEKKIPVRIQDEVRKVISDSDKSMLFILLSIASWFMAWNALEIWYSPYASAVILGNTVGSQAYLDDIGTANSSIGLVPILFVVATLPGGVLGYKIGRRNVIKGGLLLFMAAMVFATFQTTLGMSALALMIAGVAWGLINVNSIVIVWELAKKNIGAGTGLYYLSSSFAAVAGPLAFGLLLDITNDYAQLWYFSIFWLLLASIFMLKVGEKGESANFAAIEGLSELD